MLFIRFASTQTMEYTVLTVFEHFSTHTNDRIRMHFNLIGVLITSTVDGTKSK